MIFSCSTTFKCLCKDDGLRGLRLAETAYQSLSPEEQDGVDGIVYGYGETEAVEETPEFIEIMLDELDRELGLLSEERKKYYTKAIAIEQRQLLQEETSGSEEYIGSEQFRLQFLRAEFFDVPAAARRLVEYFQHKFELFGEKPLARRIKHSDLNDDEKEALVSAAMTYTGVSDMAGRPVLLIRRQNMLRFSVDCIKRLYFYILQKVVDDNETAQKRGLIYFLYHMDMPFLVNPTLARSYHPIARMVQHGLPVRHAAIHIYYDDLRDHVLVNLVLVLFTRNERARVLTHFKHSHQECILDAVTFGIILDQLPLTDEGKFQYEEISEYRERQRRFEEST